MQSPEPFLSKLQKQAGRQKHHRGEVRNPGLGCCGNFLGQHRANVEQVALSRLSHLKFDAFGLHAARL